MKHLTLVILRCRSVGASADTIESHVARHRHSTLRIKPLHKPLHARAGLARHAQARRGGQPPAGRSRRTAGAVNSDRSRWAQRARRVATTHIRGRARLLVVGDHDAAGIIIIDPIYDYSVEEQVSAG